LNDKITGFHTISRKYFIDILSDIKNKNMKIRNQFIKIYKINDGCCSRSINEFENDITVRKLIDELNGGCPYWYIKKEVLEAILRRIEEIVPEDFHSLGQIKESVLCACIGSGIDEHKHFGVTDDVKAEICSAEKNKFCNYIDNVTEKDLSGIGPLFYRRVLSDNEIYGIKSKIESVCYNPDIEKGVIACFKQEDFEAEASLDKIIDILRQHGVSNIYEINTGGIDTASYIMDVSVFDPFYLDGFNIYWCTAQLDWVIIKDHEGYYLIYGKWLINEIGKVWGDYEKKLVSFS
jgi:hypothetical protein